MGAPTSARDSSEGQTINVKRRLANKLENVPVQVFKLGSLACSFIGKVALLGLLALSAARAGQTSTGSQAVPRSNVVARSNLDGLITSAEPDWPQWRGPRRDGISDEKDLLPTWPKSGPRLVWKIGNLGHGWSSPIIVRGRLYITGDMGDDLVISAFSLEGKSLWQTKNGRAWTGPKPGARACCAFSDGKLYHMNAHGLVACLDAATGKAQWSCDLRQRFQAPEITWGFSECLLVDGPRLFVTPGGGKALMAALDKQNGRTIWVIAPLGDDRATYSAPVLFRHAGRRILANCSSGHGFGVDADRGKLLWTVPLHGPHDANVAAPIYHDGRILYMPAYANGTCYRLRPAETGPKPEKEWSTILKTHTAALLLVDGRLYGGDYQKRKSWLCLDWDSGQIRYEFPGLTTGSAVYADGRLYALGTDGRVALLKPTSEKFEIDGQFQVVAEKIDDAWSHPVLLHGRLYLRYHDALWCYDVRAK